MASISHSRLARLHLDLSELISSPPEGVSVHFDDSNMYKFCLHLCPDSGPYKGLRLHFDVELPRTWPSQPPKVQSSASIDHPNVYGSSICCDLLKEPHELQTGYTGGFTPALTLRGLFMQFLTFFSSERVEQDYGYWVTLGEAWVETKPKATGSNAAPVLKRNHHPSPDGRERLLAVRAAAPSGFVRSITPSGVRAKEVLAKYLPQAQLGISVRQSRAPAYMRPPANCALVKLNEDTLYELLDLLPSDSLINFCSAFPRAHVMAAQFHMLLLRELRCFFLRTPLVDCVLGIGVTFDPKSRMISSEFDWLSEYAFDAFSVRLSIRKKDFSFFLPLAFSKAHFDRAEPSIWKRLLLIDNVIRNTTARRSSPRLNQLESIQVIYQFMNNIVLSLMKVTDTLMDSGNGAPAPALMIASERAVISYCQLYHLLTSLAGKRPDVVRIATSQVRRFLANSNSRNKACVPDMGEFIVMASLVMGSRPIDGKKAITWNFDLNGPLLEEVFVRNVKWILKDHPELEVLETGLSEYRLQKTFDAVQTSLRLTMFQVAFLTTFVAPHFAHPSRLVEGYGFPVKSGPCDIPVEQRMVDTIKSIYAVKTWPEFFEKVQFTDGRGWGYAELSNILRECVRKSAAARYHHPSTKMARMSEQRKLLESRWERNRRGAVRG